MRIKDVAINASFLFLISLPFAFDSIAEVQTNDIINPENSFNETTVQKLKSLNNQLDRLNIVIKQKINVNNPT